MPSIRGEHCGRASVIRVGIIDAARYSQHKQSDNPLFSGVRPFRALIDTGATLTMISPEVAALSGLQAVTKIPIRNVSGSTYVRGYLFHVAFFGPPHMQFVGEDNDTIVEPEINKLQVLKKLINGGEFGGGTSFDVLLGMDVISTGDLTVSKDGTFRFDF